MRVLGGSAGADAVYFSWKHREDFLPFFPFIRKCCKSSQKPVRFLADSSAEEGDYPFHLWSKKCSHLAKRMKERNNSTYPRNQRVCLHLLQAQNSVIWGYSAGMPSGIKPEDKQEIH